MSRFLATVGPGEVVRFMRQRPPLEEEFVGLHSCLGRVLARDITAPGDLPPFRRSTVDGFAVAANDTTGASPSSSTYLELAGEVLVGRPADLVIAPGSCCRVATGGMLPEGADAVVMVEETRELPGKLVEISGSVARGENVVAIGEDLAAGAPVLAAGAVLRPQEVGVLAGLGVVAVPVRRRVRVAVLSTGDELVEPAVVPGPGQVRNVNQYSLMAQVEALGGEPVLLGIAPDDREEIERRVRRGLQMADLVLVSGGSSVGVRDLTAAIIDAVGPPGVLFHGVSVRPGKPTIVGQSGERLIVGLPGHPVSAMVSFLIFVRPAILALAGAAEFEPPPLEAVLADNIHSRPGREDYVQVKLVREVGSLSAVPLFRKSGMITAMTGADGYLVIPGSAEGLEAGERVAVHLYPRVMR